MATTVQSEVPMAGSVAKLVNRLSKVEDPSMKMAESKKQLHIVVFEYKSQQNDEIDMEVNDIIEILKTVEDGWNRGRNERTGAVGMYPTNYCDVYRWKGGVGTSGVSKQYVPLKKTETTAPFGEVPSAIKRISGMEGVVRGREETALPSVSASPPTLLKEEPEKEYARVTFDYEAQHEDELTLKVGQTVWVVRKNTTDSGWYEGEVDGRRGLFPDNFVTLMKPSNGVGSVSTSTVPPSLPLFTPSTLSSSTSSLSNTPSARVGDKPPASLPGAISVMPLPPQVPAKPQKSMGGNGVSGERTPSVGNGTPGWKMSSSATTLTHTPSANNNTLPVTFPSTPPSAEKEEEKEIIRAAPSTFQDKKALLANLHISSLNPSIPRPAASLSKSTTRIDQEGVSNENGESASKETPLLSHPTKNRPKVPSGVRRPVSMFPPPTSQMTSSTYKDGMTRSEVVLSEQPAPIGSSTSLSPSAISISPPLPSKEKENPPSFVSSSFSSSGTPTAHHSVNHTSPPDESSHSQWVSRSEYNQLLAKVSLLEERLAVLERR